MKRLILIDESQILYTIPEAVEKTGKSRATLFRWRKLDRIEFEKVGRNVYISQKEIDRLNREALMEEGYKSIKATRWDK